MKDKISQEEIIRIIGDFINENGLWYPFKDFVEQKGYDVSELGFKEED